ncbi:MAG: thiopurine S-methyltransferase [Colwelliaceae bacterium]|nr:thiopurine S-methyltransferase [Colwelliaceae bacterium]
MKESFWHACWERNSLGFHQKSIHPFLSQYLSPLISDNRFKQENQKEQLPTVFVPLCGKTDDMVWLAERFNVVGAELSDIACRDFFIEKDIVTSPKAIGDFKRYTHQNIELWQGDFFGLKASQFQKFDWIYDRAAIIALPKAMQQRYAEHLTTFIDDKTKLFLISLEFPQEELEGPPFAIVDKDVRRLFSNFKIECIAEHDLEDKTFAQRTFNVSYLKEKLFIISK